MPTSHRLVFYPRMSASLRHEIELDNISLRPQMNVQATATASSVIAGNCLTLNATGTGQDFVWEPADEFTNPIGSSQMVCPDSTTTYIVTVYDSMVGCTISDSITIYVEGSLGLSSQNMPEVKVYPNPVNDVLTIQGLSITEQRLIELVDMTGKVIYRDTISPNQDLIVDVKALSQGIYYCKVEGFKATKFIKL